MTTWETLIKDVALRFYDELRCFFNEVRSRAKEYQLCACITPACHTMMKMFYDDSASHEDIFFIDGNSLFAHADDLIREYNRIGKFPRVLLVDFASFSYGQQINSFLDYWINLLIRASEKTDKPQCKEAIITELRRNTRIFTCYRENRCLVLKSSFQSNFEVLRTITATDYFDFLESYRTAVDGSPAARGSIAINTESLPWFKKDKGITGTTGTVGIEGFEDDFTTLRPTITNCLCTCWRGTPQSTYSRIFRLQNGDYLAACVQIRHLAFTETTSFTPYIFLSPNFNYDISTMAANAIDQLSDSLLAHFCRSNGISLDQPLTNQYTFDECIRIINGGMTPAEIPFSDLPSAVSIIPTLRLFYDSELQNQGELYCSTVMYQEKRASKRRFFTVNQLLTLQDNPHVAISQVCYLLARGLARVDHPYQSNVVQQPVTSDEYAIFVMPHYMREYNPTLILIWRRARYLNKDFVSTLERFSTTIPEFAKAMPEIMTYIKDMERIGRSFLDYEKVNLCLSHATHGSTMAIMGKSFRSMLTQQRYMDIFMDFLKKIT